MNTFTIDRTAALPQSWDTQWGPVSIGGETLQAVGNWSLTSVVGNVWNFTLSLFNNADSGARITSWGFNTDPNSTLFAITAPAGWSAGGAQGGMTVEHCGHAGPNCVGGGGGGLAAGGSLDFIFEFVNTADEIVMDNFLTRWQSVGLNDKDSTILRSTIPGTPDQQNVIPLPAAVWLMLAGLGGLGLISRRKTKAA